MSRQEIEQVINEIEPRVSTVARDVIPGERHYLVANKTKRQVLLFDGEWRLLKMYPFTGFSGSDGPKRREGDGHIPEGVYAITHLNPQSRFHLSLRLDYPNALDQQYNGDNPGSDIYVHGNNVTIGCIPLGDPGIEDLFYAVHRIGKEHCKVLIYSAGIFEDQEQSYEAAIQQALCAVLPERLRGVWLDQSGVLRRP